jgi:hypothetical protein
MKVLGSPVLNFVFFSYIFNATWEWTQSPFFIDSTIDLNKIIWYRIHCSIGDTLILLAGFAVISFYHRSTSWICHPAAGHYLLMVIGGFIYTFFSEYVNVHVKQSWSYSEYMPLVPPGIGIVPLVQWLIVPPVVMFITKRQIWEERMKSVGK